MCGGWWWVSEHLFLTCLLLLYTTSINAFSIVAIVDLYPCWVSYSFLHGLGNIAQENTTNQATDVLVEDQQWLPLDLVTVSQEHKPNS